MEEALQKNINQNYLIAILKCLAQMKKERAWALLFQKIL